MDTADWPVYRARERLSLYELAALLHGLDPRGLHAATWGEWRARAATLYGPDVPAAQFLALLDASPAAMLGEPGATLERLRTATGLRPSGAVTRERARELAAALGLAWPAALEPPTGTAPTVSAPDELPSKRWTAGRVADARAMRDELKAAGRRDFTRATAAHFGVTPQRLRVLLRDAGRPKAAPDSFARMVRRLK